MHSGMDGSLQSTKETKWIFGARAFTPLLRRIALQQRYGSVCSAVLCLTVRVLRVFRGCCSLSVIELRVCP